MAKAKVSMTIDQAVRAAADADAHAAGLNRSEVIERALRNEHLRISLENYTEHTVSALGIAACPDKVVTRRTGPLARDRPRRYHPTPR